MHDRGMPSRSVPAMLGPAGAARKGGRLMGIGGPHQVGRHGRFSAVWYSARCCCAASAARAAASSVRSGSASSTEPLRSGLPLRRSTSRPWAPPDAGLRSPPAARQGARRPGHCASRRHARVVHKQEVRLPDCERGPNHKRREACCSVSCRCYSLQVLQLGRARFPALVHLSTT